MFLTNKKDILNAMKKDIEGASDSTINWLASAFNVPLSPKQKTSERKVFARTTEKQKKAANTL
jgi:hypothetical protein